MKTDYLAPFSEGNNYHIYNRTNNKEQLFKSDENRLYFLRQYAKYLSPFVDTFSWCLLPNHFHFLVRIKTEEEIKKYLQQVQRGDTFSKGVTSNSTLKPIEKKYLQNEASLSELIELEWKRFFTSYSMAFNKQHSRTGNLFHRPFKRIQVNKESYFTQAIIYIHANPLKHKVVKNFASYQWSSYQSILSDKPTHLCKQEVIDWFGGVNQFAEIHKSQSEYYYTSDISIEDE